MSVAAPLSSLAQGWGLLYPEGREDLVDAVRPLVAHREVGLRAAWEAGRQRGPPPQVQTWAVPTGWSAADFMRRALDPLTLEEQPRYLLLLGDLDELHLAFQYDLQARFSVGRLCFPSLEGYAAYAQKLIANETRPAEWREPRLLLFSTSQAETPDRTLDHLHEAMIRALHQRFARWEDYNPFNPGSVRLAGPRAEEGLRSWEALRAGAADGQPSVLLTASHGQARSKWEPEEQRALQGGVKLERRTALDPETLTRGALLPGGVWVMWSSFGVGTTKHSIYERFWSELYRAGFYSTMPNLQRLLAKDRPFVARTPMAALANPEGPLAVLGFA
ncbi:MAG: hypothetical protein H6740_29395, partial [Alphaproteobacteria bacterium]|nr:hypothetical protein [Alphaproteobacteria bacterium]